VENRVWGLSDDEKGTVFFVVKPFGGFEKLRDETAGGVSRIAAWKWRNSLG
jgi:hypothetical protein